MGSDDPFHLDEIASTAGTLGSSLEIMSKRQENSPCETYVTPVKQVVQVARKDMGAPGARPQSATVDTTGSKLSDLKAGTFNNSKITPSKPVPAASTKGADSKDTDADSDESSHSRPRM